MVDSDLIRVDLLRAKRQIYLSYPEGSIERQNFLIASKISEFEYLSKLVPKETADMVFSEYRKIIKFGLIGAGLCLGVGSCLSLMMLGFHQLHPTVKLLRLYGVPFGIGLYFCLSYIRQIVSEWKKLNPFKKEYEGLQKRKEKVIDELKDLTDEH